MLTTIMLSVIVAMIAQPGSHQSRPGGGSAPHNQSVPAPHAPSPQQHAPATNNSARGGIHGATGQGSFDRSPAGRSDWYYRRGYSPQPYPWPYYRGYGYGNWGYGYGNTVTSGVRSIRGGPLPPINVQAIHNLDATVTLTWATPDGVILEGDIFEVGRRLPGQQGFSKISETTEARFVDRQLQSRTSGAQYEVAVRRGNLWSALSAIASSGHPNHGQPWGRPFERLGEDNSVTTGTGARPPALGPPASVRAVHNLDATVTVTWVMPSGVVQEGDIFEVGRRTPGESGFSKIGETPRRRFVDLQLQTLTSGTQYAVSVRRGSVWSPMSAAASTHPSHPLAPQRAQGVRVGADSRTPAAPPPQTDPATDGK